ncbi:MAG: fibronectin type III-like domain-contianing protein, partial [Alistipes sp.]|nr:fibronectin type III-like domain-contianing protein [Alistipes sp.]
DGKEVVQLYASKPESVVERAPKELKAFQKVAVKAGATERVELSFEVDKLAYWNEAEQQWRIEKGDYDLYVGNSSEATEKVRITVK